MTNLKIIWEFYLHYFSGIFQEMKICHGQHKTNRNVSRKWLPLLDGSKSCENIKIYTKQTGEWKK